MRRLFAALAMLLSLSTTPVAADGPVVVELFTSQGCSSCPPADALMHDLVRQDGVIALAFHVDYWDYLGWKDSFAQPAFTARQQGYARAANASTIYTPQMVIGGIGHVVGSKPMQVMEMIAQVRQQRPLIDVALQRQGDYVRISAPAEIRGDFVVQLLRVEPEKTVEIRRGENAGLTQTYKNIVTSVDILSRWDGATPLELRTSAAGSTPVVVIIQNDYSGPIIGAGILR